MRGHWGGFGSGSDSDAVAGVVHPFELAVVAVVVVVVAAAADVVEDH